MNAQNQIARVLLHKDGSVHIALMSRATFLANPKAIMSLLSDPYDFYAEGYKKEQFTTGKINPDHVILEEIKGLTMAVVYADASIEIIYPELLQSIWSDLKTFDRNPINFNNYVYKADFNSQKQFLIRMFLDYTKASEADVTIGRQIPISQEFQEKAFREMANASYIKALEKTITVATIDMHEDCSEENESDNQSIFLDPVVSDEANMIPIKDYAFYSGVSVGTVLHWIRNGKVRTAQKKEKDKWYIDKNEPRPQDRRKGKTQPKKKPLQKIHRLKGLSYVDVQEWLEQIKIYTARIRPFIRTKAEADYYIDHYYREVAWNVPALIIDIDPDYYVQSKKKTNYELIMDGDSPRVPGNESSVFHLHHIGQQKNSPLAIIPSHHHNSKEYSSVFHQTSGDENLHDEEFELEKKLFWRQYLSEYDSAGSYAKIPVVSSKNNRKG